MMYRLKMLLVSHLGQNEQYELLAGEHNDPSFNNFSIVVYFMKYE